jgi:hypothetical protein
LRIGEPDPAQGRCVEAQHKVVFLADVKGFSYREVAELLAVPIVTVVSCPASARVSLPGDRLKQSGSNVESEY